MANDLNLRVGFDIAQLNAELSKTNSMLANWGSQVRGIMASAFSVYAVQAFVRGSIQSLAEFERSMSEVKAITQATGDEFQALRDNALNLAGAFKALDISKLETEFGRLGFSTQEILDSTQATIHLASATGSDLATSATIAGSTLRAFNLDAKEMNRVVDVMAGALNRTGLDMSNFAESIKYVAPNAYAANISIEETSALLGILADNGIKGSMAGTTLRRIIQDLSRDGRPLVERLKELGDKGLSAADAMDEVGRIGSTGLLILTKNVDKVGALSSALGNVTGEAKEMSDIMQDNLIGDWNKLTASWERGLQKGGGMIEVLRGLTGYYTGLIEILTGQGADRLMNFFGMGSEPFNNGATSTWGDKDNKNPVVQIPARQRAAGYDRYSHESAITQQSLQRLPQDIFGLQAELDKLQFTEIKVNTETENMGRALDGISKRIPKVHSLFEGFRLSGQMLGRVFIQMSTQISSGIASAISGAQSFGEAMAQMALSVVDSIERVVLAMIIEKSIMSSWNPFAAIAVATVAFGAVKALFASIGTSSASSPSVSAGPRSIDTAQQHMNLNITGQLRGQDIYFAGQNYSYSLSRGG